MSKRRITLVAITVAAGLGLAACGSDTDSGAAPSTTAASASSQAGSGQGTPAAGEYGDADVAFAQGMIPHHAQAVEMSEILLSKDGVDERVASLAKQIKAAQGPEIDRMTGWLDGWGADMPTGDDAAGMDHSAMGHGIGGMMSEQDMMALTDADGPTASRLFLEQMIAHHRGAVEMAQTQVSQGINPEATELAKAIIDTQQAEIGQMEDLLSQF